MNSILEHFQRAAADTWDMVTRNAARVERGMQKASIGGAGIGPAVFAGYYSGPIYQEDGLRGLGYLALGLAAYCIGILAVKSRVEISQFDKKKKEEYTKDAVAFYEANKDHIPAPR